MSKSLVSCFLTHSVYTVQPTLHVVSQSVTAARRHCIHVSICTDLKIHPLLGCNFLQIDFFILIRFRLYLAEILATQCIMLIQL